MEPVAFVFPNMEGLDKLRTSVLLDARGAKLTIVGIASSCCGPTKVVVQSVMKGRGNEDPARLSLVERMIRGSVPNRYQDAWAAAVELTTLLTSEYMSRNHKCKGAVNGEAA